MKRIHYCGEAEMIIVGGGNRSRSKSHSFAVAIAVVAGVD